MAKTRQKFNSLDPHVHLEVHSHANALHDMSE